MEVDKAPILSYLKRCPKIFRFRYHVKPKIWGYQEQLDFMLTSYNGQIGCGFRSGGSGTQTVALFSFTVALLHWEVGNLEAELDEFDASREIRIGGLVSDANHINPKCLDRNPLAAEFVGNPAIYCVSVLSVPLILVAASAGPPDYLSIPNEEIFAELNRAQRLELDRADWA
ncbi:hypothetical protein E6O75_ATG04366 [Venturia nashicola]|uniref:Uncharacterized protein n=1 Tax=Venturia nashicola TaxID=86259 RepID=A0A4Z1PI00_9PEZI|nr:hypothetical protein E6O75_ATG04366 [Venturia nashicola]